MRASRFIAVAVLSLCPIPALAQAGNSARAAVARLTAGLAVPAPLRPSLETAMATALGGDELRYVPQQRAFSVMGCDETEMAATLVDLNGDATPEVHVEAMGTCVGGMAGSYSWMFIRTPSTGAWTANLGFPGGLVPLESRAQGFIDLMIAGPGFCHPIWRWNGRAYAHLCNSSEGGSSCERPCPRALNVRTAGETLPPFTAAARQN